MKRAHRVAWELKKGRPIPDGQCVLHHCDNPLCVNPDHLFDGTHADNVRDRDGKNRQARGVQHGQSKLTDDDVRQIRRDSADGMTQREIAKKFGVSQRAIFFVLRGVTWKHVTP